MRSETLLGDEVVEPPRPHANSRRVHAATPEQGAKVHNTTQPTNARASSLMQPSRVEVWFVYDSQSDHGDNDPRRMTSGQQPFQAIACRRGNLINVGAGVVAVEVELEAHEG